MKPLVGKSSEPCVTLCFGYGTSFMDFRWTHWWFAGPVSHWSREKGLRSNLNYRRYWWPHWRVRVQPVAYRIQHRISVHRVCWRVPFVFCHAVQLPQEITAHRPASGSSCMSAQRSRVSHEHKAGGGLTQFERATCDLFALSCTSASLQKFLLHRSSLNRCSSRLVQQIDVTETSDSVH